MRVRVGVVLVLLFGLPVAAQSVSVTERMAGDAIACDDGGIGCHTLSIMLNEGECGPRDLWRSVEMRAKACTSGYQKDY